MKRESNREIDVVILFACECGAAYQVEDKYAGGEAECRECGKSLTLPDKSDPDVMRIFRGRDSEPVPMSKARVESGLADGSLLPNDLFWDGQKWSTLDQSLMDGGVADLSKLGTSRGGQILLRIASGGGRSGSEIIALPHIVLHEPEDIPLPVQVQETVSSGSRVNKLKRVAVLALIIGAVVGGIRFGWPVLARLMNRSAQLIVFNNQAGEVAVRLNEKDEPVSIKPGALAQLKVKARQPGEQMLWVGNTQVSFTAEPGRVSFASLGNQKDYPIVDRGALSVAEWGQSLDDMIGQIKKRQMPLSGTRLADNIEALVSSSTKHHTKGGVLPEADNGYDIELPDGSLHKTSDAEDNPLLLLKTSDRFSLKAGWIDYDFSEGQVTEAEVTLSAFSFYLEKLFKVVVASGQKMSVQRRGNDLNFEMRIPNQRIQQGDMKVQGTWTYTATVPAPKAKSPVRRWEWRFRGYKTIGGSRFVVTVLVDYTGKRKVDLKKG